MKDHLKPKLVEMLKEFPTIQACCKKLGIGRATYYRWVSSDADFARQAREALDDGVFDFNGIAENWLLEEIRNGNKSAIYFWLKKKHPEYMPINRLERKDTDSEYVEHESSGR